MVPAVHARQMMVDPQQEMVIVEVHDDVNDEVDIKL